MKLAQLVAEPQLTKVIIDDAETVKQFGEALEFWVYDRQDMDTFMKLATVNQDNFGEIAEVIRKLVLDEEGKPVLKGKATLPMGVMLKVIEKVVSNLGNSVSQTMEA